MKPKKQRSKIWLLIISVVLVLLSSYLLWWLKPTKALSVLILDNTVPDTTYREHKGLMWILNHLKYFKSHEFSYDQDYFGFFPLPDHHYQIKSVPKEICDYDLIYIADTYGVYEEEFYKDKEKIRGLRSRLIYGGLHKRDLKIIEQNLKDENFLIAEFNSFSSPTGAKARQGLTALLGLNWSGWIGRYFVNLRKDIEVPTWVVEGYELQYNQMWAFEGPGFIFTHESGRLLVLEENDVGDDALKIIFPDEMAKKYGVRNRIYYLYWFDIVWPSKGTEVVANYHLDLTPSGRRILAKEGIPEVFPAILKNEINKDTYTSYYFAGDFADSNLISCWWRLRWLDLYRKYLSINTKANPAAFYWKVYVPLMKTILSQIEPEKEKLNIIRYK